MRRCVRLCVLFVLASALIAAPTVLIVARAERGSASFGDAEVVGRNRLGSATVDIEAGRLSAPVLADRLAPGDVVAGTIDVTNAGSIPVSYSIVASGEVGALAPWITWWFSLRRADLSCPTAEAWAEVEPAARVTVAGREFDGGVTVRLVGDPTPGPDDGDRTLPVGESEQLCIAALLDPAAPNSVQAVTAALDVTFDSEQWGAEVDDARAAP